MIRNYLMVAVRNLKKYKGFSLINILGLSVGLACVIIISMIIRFELSFDDFDINKDRIYKVYVKDASEGKSFSSAPVMMPFAPVAKQEIPEIEEAVRISEHTVLSAYEDKKFYESIIYVDPAFFNVFTYKFIEGNPSTAITEPRSIVITKNIAEKYFGKEDPVNKLLKFNNGELYKVTAVIENIPANSHLDHEIFASMNSLNETTFPRLTNWGNFGDDYTYILLKKNTDPSVVEKKFENIINENFNKPFDSNIKLALLPLKQIHFSSLIYDSAKTTAPVILYVFSAIALFILLIACVNFINLTTSHSSRRNKEIGVRKVVGANRSQLVKQFLSESYIITFISFGCSLGLVEFALPYINAMLNRNLSFAQVFDFTSILTALIVLLFTGFTAGAYPAFVLSAAKPAVVLKTSLLKKRSGFSLRAALVVFQFAITAFLITGTLTVYSQLNYLLTRDLGFPGDRIVVLQIDDKNLIEHGEPLKRALLSNPNILSASYSDSAPGSNRSHTRNFTVNGAANDVDLQAIEADYDFVKTYDLKINEGRYFSSDFSTDTNAYILNKAAMSKLGITDVAGRTLKSGSPTDDNKYYNIIGTMQNFNYSSLKQDVPPLVFILRNTGNRFLSLQLNAAGISNTMDFIKDTYSKYAPDYPFRSFFINQSFEKYYQSQRTLGKLLSIFTLLAIFISSIGILGLVAFAAEQKSKEIGIRKVLGASVSSVVVLLCKEFIKWVLLANILILPLAYLAANKFLDGFAYRISFNYMIFFVSMLVTLVITLLTVSFHTIKAAIANPVESLRYE